MHERKKEKMKPIVLISAVIGTILLAFIIINNKEKIFCPYCKHFFTIVEVRRSDRQYLKTDWLGCSHCKKVFGYNYDGELEKAYKSSYDYDGNFHSEVVMLE